MLNSKQMSESILCGILLALSGGSMDAYSYLFRDKVFANAQTGNMLLFGVNMAEGNFAIALKYLCPILVFTIGIILADCIRYHISNDRIHWRQLVVGLEAAALLCVAFIPTVYNPLANAIISLACGMQVEAFRKIEGNSIATTMCIGNLRSGTSNLDNFILTKDGKYIKRAALYYGIIATFILGAIIESILIKWVGSLAIIASSFLLLVTLLLMIKGGEELPEYDL